MKNENLKKTLGLVALSLVMFMVTLDSTITNIALPTITDYYGANLTDSNWISTVYVLVMSVFIIPASKLADQFGRKRVMLIGLSLFGVGSALCALSGNLVLLIAMRVIQGLGGAIVTPVMIPLSVENFGKEKAGRAVGIIGAVTAVAAAAGPPIGGFLIRYFNWQTIFYVNVPVVIITFALITICFIESFDLTISKKIDWLGMLFLSLGLFQLTFVLVRGYDMGWMSTNILLLIAGAIISLIIFFIVELKVPEPLMEFALFKEITFSSSTVVYFICGFAVVCSSLIFNFFLQNVRGYTALNAAYIIMFMSLTVMISMPLGSKLAEKIGFRSIIFTGILLMSASLLLLTRLSMDTTRLLMIGEMMLLGFGFGFSCLSIVSAVQYIPQTKAGIGSGIVNAARQLGTCLGIALLVGLTTHQVDVAKTNIEQKAVKEVNSSSMVASLKTVLINDLQKNSSSTSKDGNELQKIIEKDMEKAMKGLEDYPKPANNEVLQKLFEGSAKMTLQFEKGNGTTGGTIFDGISGINEGSRSLASGIKGYVNLVNESLYQIIQSNPYAPELLGEYIKELESTQQTYKTAAQGQKNQMKDKMNFLTYLISIYSVGTDPDITTGEQFQRAVAEIGNSDPSSNTITAASSRLIEGAGQLAATAKEIDAQFADNGDFKAGAVNLEKGIGQAGQISEVKEVVTQIANIKNNEIVAAFTKTFLVAAFIILLSAFAGLFTDRKKRSGVISTQSDHPGINRV
ncbi:MFS transporter [Paenibacillus tritici]|uniref:MFS transporter n=1 Tax=Paenibacillus tritici TaxID=1873425 RepID=A0ABX2DQ09_9BACL|nr:MFS transporter [Paenibacillus tritici]NQX46098.1 MFS transporter [Paenibacillus tritici]